MGQVLAVFHTKLTLCRRVQGNYYQRTICEFFGIISRQTPKVQCLLKFALLSTISLFWLSNHLFCHYASSVNQYIEIWRFLCGSFVKYSESTLVYKFAYKAYIADCKSSRIEYKVLVLEAIFNFLECVAKLYFWCSTVWQFQLFTCIKSSKVSPLLMQFVWPAMRNSASILCTDWGQQVLWDGIF